jgi:hypothetical protein
MTDIQSRPAASGQPDNAPPRIASGLWLHVVVGAVVLLAPLLFYAFVRAVHQDLAGSALSGRLAVTLGDAFRSYSVYFPPAERVWFSAAARLSDLTGLRLDLAVVLMTGMAVLFSAGLAYRIRRQTVGASPQFLIASAAVLVVLPILFKNIFGLREHMIALGLWPYLVLRVSDPEGTRVGWRLRTLIGLWLGAMLLFKYLYSLVVALVEMTDAIVQRRPLLLLRVENLAAGTVVALYLFCWLVLDPGQRAAIGAMFSAIDANLVDPRLSLFKVAENMVYALALALIMRVSRVPGRLIVIGLAAVVGAVAVAWSQERWYTHHLFPIILAFVAWWWMAGRRLRLIGHAAMVLCLSVPLIREYRNAAVYQERVAELDEALTGAGLSVAGKHVGILTMHPSPYNEYLAAKDGLRWNALMNTAYMAAELQPYDTPQNAGKLAPPVKLDDPGRRLLHDQMLRLWEDRPPEVLIIDHSYRWPLRYLDVEWVHGFSKDRRFNAILSHYRPVLVHDGKRISFTYYVRAD